MRHVIAKSKISKLMKSGDKGIIVQLYSFRISLENRFALK